MGIKLFSGSEDDMGRFNQNTKVEYIKVYDNKNPDPKNFHILKTQFFRTVVCLWVKYPNCTNYEGNKILVIKDFNEEVVMNKMYLDPHFCDKSEYGELIARFVPTTDGWQMALKFANMIDVDRPRLDTMGITKHF